MSFPAESRLDAVLNRFGSQRVLVLGDLMVDRYLWGDTARISPEAPVPIIEAREETIRLGGAANVANNIRSLGGKPILVGVIGGDAVARELVELLHERDVSTEGLVTDRSRLTTTKTRILARNQQIVRVDREDAAEVSGEVLDRMLDQARAALVDATACVISDYGKGVISQRLLMALLPEAAKRGVPVCVDPKESHFLSYKGVAVITPNQAEAGVAFGKRIRDLQTLLTAGRFLRDELNCQAVLITRGDQGMTLFQRDVRPYHFPAVSTEVFDVTGAGDTVVSTYALALGAGAEPPEAAAIANHAAGIVVREVGTSVTTPNAVRHTFGEDGGGADPQILDDTALDGRA